MFERRSVPRKETSLRGEIIVGYRTLVACMVTDLSTRGARVTLLGDVDLPGEFHLRTSGEEVDVIASTVWRKERELGVRFLLFGKK